MDKHTAISKLKELATELGRIPTRDEARAFGIEHILRKLFGSFTGAKQAAGLDFNTPTEKKKKPKKWYVPAKPPSSPNVHVIDLEELFQLAGNPEVLRVTTQGDTHEKNKDERAYGAYLEWLDYYQPHVHIIMGDFLDCGGISPFEPDDYDPKRLVPELKSGRVALEQTFHVNSGASKRIYLCGNHEDWVRQALVKMPELFSGLQELDERYNFTIPALLGLNKWGVDFYEVNHVVKIGNAHFTHGMYHGDNHPKQHLVKLKGTIYYGHLHDGNRYADSSVRGTEHGKSVHCLCRLNPSYLKNKPNNWTHGITNLEFRRDGSFTEIDIVMQNGKFSFNGKIFG